jgi:hypothetical protein
VRCKPGSKIVADTLALHMQLGWRSILKGSEHVLVCFETGSSPSSGWFALYRANCRGSLIKKVKHFCLLCKFACRNFGTVIFVEAMMLRSGKFWRRVPDFGYCFKSGKIFDFGLPKCLSDQCQCGEKIVIWVWREYLLCTITYNSCLATDILFLKFFWSKKEFLTYRNVDVDQRCRVVKL